MIFQINANLEIDLDLKDHPRHVKSFLLTSDDSCPLSSSSNSENEIRVLSHERLWKRWLPDNWNMLGGSEESVQVRNGVGINRIERDFRN